MGQIISLTSAATSTTPLEDLPSPPPLLLLLDVPCPDLKSLFLCHLARVHQEDRSSFTHSQVSFTSQEWARQSTFDFHSQVNTLWRSCLQVLFLLSLASQHSLKIVLASAPMTFTRKSLHLSRTCLQVHYWLSLISHFAAAIIPFGKACHCGTDLFCGAVILLLRAWYCHQVPHILLRRMPTLGLVLLLVQYLLRFCSEKWENHKNNTLTNIKFHIIIFFYDGY